MINKIFIIVLVLIILMSLFQKCKIKEGYVDGMMLDPKMVKNVSGVPETERLLMLSEVYKIVRNHEKLFSIYDPNEYSYQEIQQNPNKSLMENTKNLFKFLKKHDKQLAKLTETGNKYVAPTTVDSLLNGSLIKPLKDDLLKIKNIPGKSMMPHKVTDPKEIQKQSSLYKVLAQNESDPDVKKDLLDASKDKKMDLYTKVVENDPPDDANQFVDKSPRITMKEINERLQFVTLFHVSKVVQYQDEAIKEVYKIAENYITQKK